jgi:type I restriction enzyme M protein
MARNKKKNGADAAPMTTSHMLGGLLKSARDIMRKDKGLNGDLDRLPLLTWIMFLKFLDDLEQQREEEAALSGKKFKAAIEAPYRWRDWAADPQGITGEELLSFINAEEAVRPDGKKGPGLFAYLRSLSSSNGDNRRDVIATVFKGVDNRMKSGYLLRDIINKVAGIHFTSSDELHTLGALYETMLREMRDAAGDSGEFYTPRAVVRFMVGVTDPRLGETVLDPASGTGGFLVEAFSHLEKQVKTVAHRRILQQETIAGCEPKSLPYLLCQMNLLLHGLDAPQIDPGNALRFKLSEIGEKDRVDVILTNPPFGGEEEKGIRGNFPHDRRTAETALLFLQLIMRKLKRRQTPIGRPSRAAVVVPDGTLSATGTAALIRSSLLDDFALKYIIQLPPGAFAPYAETARTNILLFDTSGRTSTIWYYQVPAPMGRKQCSKKFALTDVDFDPVREWLSNPVKGPSSWAVRREDIDPESFNLLIRNPTVQADNGEASVAEQISLVSRLSPTILKQAGQLAADAPLSEPELRSLGEFITRSQEVVQVQDEVEYKQITLQYHHRGAKLRGVQRGVDIGTKRQSLVRAGQLLVSRIDARYGAIGLIPQELDGAIVTGDFWAFDIRREEILPKYLDMFFALPEFAKLCEMASRGSTRRQRLVPQRFRSIFIPWIPLDEQAIVVERANAARELATVSAQIASMLSRTELDLTREAFGVDWFQDSANTLHSAPAQEEADASEN